MFRKILAVSFALAATSSLAEGEIIWQPHEVAAELHLNDSFSPALGRGDTSSLYGMAINAQYVDEDQNPIGLSYHFGGSFETRSELKWDGLLIQENKSCNEDETHFSRYGESLSLYHQSNIELCGQKFDLTNPDDRNAFAAYAWDNSLTVSELPLIIANGTLDVREVANAPKAIRRFVYQVNWGGIGIYQTTTAMTLYDASVELSRIEPAYPDDKITMAANLPMGTHDFCMKWESATFDIEPCGINNLDNPPRFLLSMQAFRP